MPVEMHSQLLLFFASAPCLPEFLCSPPAYPLSLARLPPARPPAPSSSFLLPLWAVRQKTGPGPHPLSRFPPSLQSPGRKLASIRRLSVLVLQDLGSGSVLEPPKLQ